MAQSYLTFRLLSSTGKTFVWAIDSLRRGDQLGTIRWFPQWRQYVLAPDPSTVWNPACLRDVAKFIDSQMLNRRSQQ